MSTSIVTKSGSSACTFCNASRPFRAVAMTWNSPEASRICEMRRRMNALSSTTSTERRAASPPVGAGIMLEDTIALLQRAHLDATVVEMKMHAASMVTPDVFGNDRHAASRQCLPRRDHVSFTDVDAARGEQIREHARAPNELRTHALDVGTDARHPRQQQCHGRSRELPGVGAVSRHRFVGEERVGHSTDAYRVVVQED